MRLDQSKTKTELIQEIQSLRRKNAQDIADHKHAEAELLHNEIMFRAIFENSIDAIGVGKDGLQVSVNPALLKLFGYSKFEEVIGKPVIDIIAPSEHPRILENMKKRAAGKEAPSIYETRGIRKDGTEFDMNVHISTFKLEGENYSLAILRDVTEHKAAEEALLESENRFRSFTENAPDFVMQINHAGIIEFINRTVMGISQDDVVGSSVFSWLPKDYIAPFKRALSQVYKTAQDQVVEHQALDAQKKKRWYSSHLGPIREFGNIASVIVVARDITVQKKVEKALRQSEEKFAKIFSTSPNVITISTLDDGRFVDINEVGAKKIGYTRDELIGKTSIELGLVRPEDRDKLINILKEDGFYSGIELTVTIKGGEENIGLFYGQIIQLGDENFLFQTLVDITERKQTENALLTSEHLLRDAQAMAHIGHWQLNILTQEIEGSDELFQIFGLSQEEVTLEAFLDVVHPDDREYDLQHIRRGMEHGESWNIEHRLICKNGDEKYVHAIGEAIKDKEGKIVTLVGTIQDITERKKVEKELLESERTLRAFLDATTDSAALMDLEGNIIAINKTIARSWKKDPSEIIGSNAYVNFPPAVAKVRRAQHDKVIRTKQPVRFIDARGDKWFDNHMYPVLNEDGKVERIAIFARDITERKLAEEELKNSEERLKILFESAPDAYYINNLKGTFIDGNKAAEDLMGYKRDELIDKSFLKLNILPKNQIVKAGKLLAQNILGKSTGPDEFLLHRKDGSEVIAEIRTHPVKIGGKTLILGIARDITERKKAEEELLDSERRNKALLNTTLDLAMLIDKNGKIITLNEAMAKAFGQTPDNLINKVIYDMLPPDIARERKKKGEEAAKSGKVVRFLDRRADRWLDNSVYPIFDEKGKLLQYAIFSHDITERKLAEEMVHESEEKYRLLIDNIPDVTWSTDADGHTNFISPNIKDVYGYTVEEIGRGGDKLWFGRVHKDDLPKLKSAYMELFEENKEFNIEYRIKHKNGQWIWLHDRAIMHFETDKKKYAFGVFSDITERKEAEEEIHKLSLAVQQSANAILITSTDGLIEYVNQSFENTTGYLFDDIVGKNPRFLKSGETSQAEYKNLWDTITSGKEWKGEFHNKKKDGELYWESATISPMKNKDGEIIHFLGIKEEITERKKAIQERELALVEAKKANQVKSNFLANMSHEIRTPLNAILGFTDLLENETKKMNNPELDQYVDIIQQSGDRLMNTVHGILDISQIETGTVKLNPEPVDLKQTIIDLITTLNPGAQEKKVDIQFDSHIRKSIIQTDKYCLTQAMDNIINNAIKYTEKGSVTIQLERKGKRLSAAVTDTGIGMTEEFMKRMFDPFTQESEGYSKKYEGVGIGLPLTKRYLDLIGAELKVESKKGHGSTFTISIGNLSSA